MQKAGKKGLIVLAMLVMLALAVPACTPTATTPAATTAKPGTTAAAPGTTAAAVTPGGSTTAKPGATGAVKFDKNLKITWIVYNQFDNPVKSGGEVQKLIEQKFNVTLDIPQLDVHNNEQWAVYWSSGNTADRIQSNNMSNYFIKFADQKIIRPITMDMLRKNAPNWMKQLEALVDPKLITPQITYQDQVWLMPYQNVAQTQQVFVTAARKSWMDKAGITAAPKTLDEYYNMIVKFTKNDPDGNGKDDTYGLSLYKYTGASYVWGTFGVNPGSYYDRGGKVIYSSVSDEYKEGLKLLQSWHKEGLIDPEFITDDRKIQRVKWSEGKFGILNDHPWWFARSTPDNLTDLIVAKNPQETLVYFPAFTGKDGKSGSSIGFPQVINNGVYFGADTSDEVVERIMAIEDSFASDMDWYIRAYFGEEGKTYTKDKDGILIPDAKIMTKEKISELGLMQTFALAPGDMALFKATTSKADMPAYDASYANKKLFSGRAFAINGVNQVLTDKGADISRIADEYYINAVSGKADIDATWDQYKKDLDQAGLSQILAEFEKIIVR